MIPLLSPYNEEVKDIANLEEEQAFNPPVKYTKTKTFNGKIFLSGELRRS